ncbi:globin [Corynebacterium alimapuense]|uniref:Globin n=1 Tax=Corynebacterium alimapuense TaxID=1576874 RepID=A0A3M8KAU1_9CORY|nr:globin [Corynebacterium alimapuense]RNE49664.1 globin [Corynebacterium alimapuense]
MSAPESFYDAVGGDATFTRLARGFYEQIPDDEILGPMYPAEDLDGAQDRLKWFLAQYWGGPTTFNEQRGAPMLRRRHVQFPVDRAAAERWLELMGRSLAQIDETIIPNNYRHAIWEHMERVAAMLINQPDPGTPLNQAH